MVTSDGIGMRADSKVMRIKTAGYPVVEIEEVIQLVRMEIIEWNI
jgi:hypothetical protein